MEKTIKEVNEIVRNIVDQHTYLRKNKHGRFDCELYVDYRDGLSHDQIKEISEAKDKMQAFYECFDEYVMDLTDDANGELMDQIENHWDEDEHGEFDDEIRDAVRDWMMDNIDINFPYDDYLRQDVKVNILLDTGDANYDYTLNNFASYNAVNDEEIPDESSILWLVRQQGYTFEHLQHAIEGEYFDSKFLKSVHRELINVSSHMNALGFFVTMTLKEYIEFIDNKKSIVLGKDTSCGLYDCWGGAGGCLEIELEKPVELTWDIIDPHIEGCGRGYSVDEIYGMMGSFWRDSVIEYKEVKTDEN